MPKFRKKPVEIEAQRLVESNIATIANWCHGKGCGVLLPPSEQFVLIETLEGEMQASMGDWVIKGVQGEFYPCKPDIFAATYEPVA